MKAVPESAPQRQGPPWRLFAGLGALCLCAVGWVFWQSREIEIPAKVPAKTAPAAPTPRAAYPESAVPAAPPPPAAGKERAATPPAALRGFRGAPAAEEPKEPEPAPAAPEQSPPSREQYQRYQQEQMARIFQTQCANCHGFQGKGDGPMAGTYAPLVDFSSPAYWRDTNPEKMSYLILSGSLPDRTSKRMPGFRGQLEDQDMDAMIAYLRNFKVEETAPEPKAAR